MDGEQRMLSKGKRKSLRLQHSISLRIPMEELDETANHMNCYVDLKRQVFSLTYLEENETQNPDSLTVLEGLRRKNWQVYFVSTLYCFDYNQEQMISLSRALKNAFSSEFLDCNQETNFHSEVSSMEDLNPTENDSQALKITVSKFQNEKESLLYEGYLISWCNPEKGDGVLLPILICCGKKRYHNLIHTILSEKLDIRIQKMLLTQGEFLHLFTCCLIMLGENDGFYAKMIYETLSGTINVEISVESLLKLWKKIHKDESIEVELDEVLLFNEAFEKFVEACTGMTLGCTIFQSVNVKGCFSLDRVGQVKFFSTKTIHVVLKYLNYLAVQRLKLKALCFLEINSFSSEPESMEA